MPQIIGATLKSTVGVCDFELHLPSGVPYFIRFKPEVKDGDAVAYVPKTLTYTDDFGKTKILIENLPQHLLDKYSHIELVSVKQEEEIKKDVIVDKKKKVEKPVDPEADYQPKKSKEK